MTIRIFFTILSLLISQKLFAQTIKDELEAKQRKERIQKQMQIESNEQLKSEQQAIKKLTIFKCDVAGPMYYAFGPDQNLYIGLMWEKYQTVENTTFNPAIKFVSKERIFSWQDSYDFYEFIVDDYMLYKKSKGPNGSIESSKCKLSK